MKPSLVELVCGPFPFVMTVAGTVTVVAVDALLLHEGCFVKRPELGFGHFGVFHSFEVDEISADHKDLAVLIYGD